MPQPELDYRKIRRRAEEQLKQEKFQLRMALFFGNLLMFVVFAVLAWGLYLSHAPFQPFANGDDPIMGALILLTMAGIVGVIFQFMSLMSDTTRGERRIRERAYGKVMNEELMRLGEEDDSPFEKAKHMMHLSDDGELEAISDEDDMLYETKQQMERQGHRKS